MQPSDHTPFIQILGQMLIVDGMLSDKERAYLDEVMDRIGMAADARRPALSGISLDSAIEERIALLSADAKQLLKSELESAALADGETHRREASFLDRVRAALG